MTAIVQAGANQPLSFTVGDDVSLRLTVTENSVAYDWTGATVTTSIIANGAAVATNFTTATSAGGILDLSLTDTETTTLGLGTFDYWVKVTKASVTSTWVAGQLTMHAAQYGSASNLSSSLSITTAASTTLAITLSGYAYLSPILASGLTLTEQTAPSAPSANNVILYAVADNTQTRIKAKTDAGITYDVSPADQYKHKPTRSFMRRMRQGRRPQTIVMMGDSTSAGVTKWFYPLIQRLGVRFPAYTIRYWEWNDTMQGWAPASGQVATIQTGTAGEAYQVTNGLGITCNAAAVTASTGYNVVGDQSHRCKFQPDGTWVSITLGGQQAGGGTSAKKFNVDASGNLVWAHSVSGATYLTATSTAAVPFISGQKGWVRCDVDVDNGASGWTVTFYTSTDELTWTALGSPVITATVTSVYGASTAAYNIGNLNGGSGAPAGKMYEYKIFNGIGSTTQTLVLAWCAADIMVDGAAGVNLRHSGYDVCGNVLGNNSTGIAAGVVGAPTLHVRNASVSGMALNYFDDTLVAGRFAKMNTGRIDLTFLSLSHNEGGTYATGGDLYRTNFSTFVTMSTANAPYGGVVLVGQNPKTPYPGTVGSVNDVHMERIRCLNDIAAAGNHGWIDAYEALAVDTATYISGDTTHPTAAGYAVWTATAEAFIDQA